MTLTAPESTPEALPGAPGAGAGPRPGRPAHRCPGVLVARQRRSAWATWWRRSSSGFAILGSAFLLAWAAESLQLDVSQGLALTVLALIAVLPEYAVDFTFAYKAGEDPDKFAPLALANMTGGNRLLIGIGWSMVVLLAAWRMTSIARQRGYTRRARHRRAPRTAARDRDHVPRDRDARTRSRCRSSTRSRSSTRVILIAIFVVLRLPALAGAGGGTSPRRPGAAHRCAPDDAATHRRRRVARVRRRRSSSCAPSRSPSRSCTSASRRASTPSSSCSGSRRSRPKRPSCSSPRCSRGGSTPARASARCCRRR